MWRELIRQLTADQEPIGELDPGPEFFPGATEEQLAAVERALGVGLPESLRSLLRESNGVYANFGTPIIWSTEEIERTNREMREGAHYRETWMPFDHLLFFAGAGVDGILFAFPLIQGRINRDCVYAWFPIEDNREMRATSLRDYLESWLSGRLKV